MFVPSFFVFSLVLSVATVAIFAFTFLLAVVDEIGTAVVAVGLAGSDLLFGERLEANVALLGLDGKTVKDVG